MARADPVFAHKTAQISPWSLQYHMNVIGHEAIKIQTNIKTLNTLAKLQQESLAILI